MQFARAQLAARSSDIIQVSSHHPERRFGFRTSHLQRTVTGCSRIAHRSLYQTRTINTIAANVTIHGFTKQNMRPLEALSLTQGASRLPYCARTQRESPLSGGWQAM